MEWFHTQIVDTDNIANFCSGCVLHVRKFMKNNQNLTLLMHTHRSRMWPNIRFTN